MRPDLTKNRKYFPAPALWAALTLAALASAPDGAAKQPYDGIVAVVDDQIILLSEVEDLRQALADQQPGLSKLSPDAQRRELLDRLIDDKVVLVKAKQDTTIKVSEKDLAPRADEAISRYVEQQGGEKKLETLLKQTNGMTLAQFRAKLTQQYVDQSYRQKLQYKYVGDHEPSNSQVREFYQSYKDSLPAQQNSVLLSHIQMKVKPGAILERAAYLKADSLIKRLDKGESLADLAKQYSDDFSGKDGGDIGYTKRGVLDPDYEKAAFNLEAGDYARIPVRSRHGYHVIKVTAKKDNEVRTSHILIKLVPEAADSARTMVLMDSLRSAALKGAGFPALALKYSDDRKTKDNGGSLGWFTKDQIDPRYLAAVDTLEEGGISAPVVIGEGYHIFRLDKKAAERQLTPDEDWTQISQIAKSYFLNQKLSGFVRKWRETVHIEDRLSRYKNLEALQQAGGGEAPSPN